MIGPDMEWLQRRWNLPDSAIESVAALLEAFRQGGTALRLDGSDFEWGSAADDGANGESKPLVVLSYNESRWLQSRRLFDIERFIASRVCHLAKQPVGPVSREVVSALFSDTNPNPAQVNAASLALSRAFCLITGGPGTGKTYTLARILAGLVESKIDPTKIFLAAPTGKAADQMKTAVARSLESLPAAVESHRDALERIAGSAVTLHTLLGYNPDIGRCRANETAPLDCAVLIVDECSMVDIFLWAALLHALPVNARLVLIGDPNQLESVGLGSGFSALAKVASHESHPLRDCHAHLTTALRFAERPGIMKFAQALEASDGDQAVALLESLSHEAESLAGLSWIDANDGVIACADFPPTIQRLLRDVADAGSPADALRALGEVCILTAQREYFVGSTATSAAIDRFLSADGPVTNRPVIINRNDPETGLRNGTVGVIHEDADGTRRAWFPGVTGQLEPFAVSALPDFSPAWAITIHRSQGSEYANVLVILPRKESPLATRELLYTAITRARDRVTIVGSLSAVRQAASTPSTRSTLLEMQLLRADENKI